MCAFRIQSLKIQYAAAAAFVFAAGFAVATTISTSVVDDAARSEHAAEAASAVREATRAIEAIQTRSSIYADLISRKRDFAVLMQKGEDNERLNAIIMEFEELKKRDPAVSTFEVTNAAGIILGRGHNPGVKGDDKSKLKDIKAATDGKLVSGLVVSPTSGDATIGAVAPVKTGSGVIGTLRVGSRPTRAIVAEIKARTGADIALYFKRKATASTFEESQVPVLSESDYARAMAGEADLVAVPISDRMYLSRLHHLPSDLGEGLVLAVFVDGAPFAARIAEFRQSMVLYGLIALPFVILLGFLTGRWFARPLVKTAGAMDRLTAGRDATLTSLARRGDEVGDIARSFGMLAIEVENAVRLHQTVAGMPTGLLTIHRGKGWVIDYVNPALIGVLGAVGKLLPAAPDQLEGMKADVLFGSVGLTNATLETLPEDGLRHRASFGHLTFLLTLANIRSKQGEKVGVMVAWENMTDRQELAANFESAVLSLAGSVEVAAITLRERIDEVRTSASTTQIQAEAVARASEESSASVTTVASAAEQLRASIGDIGHHIEASSAIAGQATKDSQHLVGVVRDLSIASEKIGAIVQVIGTIASQTNLLALNATIEAARAGEAGRGFAVVASEVKALASQTTRAADQVVAQIGSIQQKTGEVVNALQSVASTIEAIGGNASGVSASVEQQRSATEDIVASAQQTAASTNEVATSMTEVSVATSRTEHATESMLAQADVLKADVARLRQEVNRFLKSLAA
ncbi:methyl-accepting chemotaxis protein [Rhabdaerophilum sp. SD176]|uniref:methyl-accepting chemotaxis protein n=1 Tax=Rhabdaerophilum sp. SD176 TaxID=2983548 RepID=UPI0024DF41BF|nr:methyl-accepting chemotaxis protein [Rhabdaerophilum sp. SD176]